MDKELLKTITTDVIKLLLHIFLLIPIKKNHVLFYPANGHYYCNLKYIDQEMQKERLDIQRIWIAKEEADSSYPNSSKYCKLYSLLFFYYFFTSKIIVFNNAIPSWLFKRKGQIFINTWHGGGAYKKIDVFFRGLSKWRKKRAESAKNRTDYIVSSSVKFTEVIRFDTGTKAKFLPIGMPRNDIFFDEKRMLKAIEKVRTRYNINDKKGIILYAPTFRDNGIKLDLDVEKVLQAAKIKFRKEFIFCVRSHPHIAKDIFAKTNVSGKILDVSDYTDMQELLAAADILITDYSSCMWDFSLTRKPCFIYANDLNSYKKERDFHTPINKWPFPVAESNSQLIKNISLFDNTLYQVNVTKHHKALGSYEQGTASKQLCQLLSSICNVD